MRAAVLQSLGTVPQSADYAEPVPVEGEVVVKVLAAALKPVDKQIAAGSHYTSPKKLPVICGIDGVGALPDGSRVFFGGGRPPYGSMAERTVVRRAFCFPLPDAVDNPTAAAIPNPGISAWLTLAHRAKLQPGENVLILGATGVTGQLAVKIAKLLGAARVVAAGRNPQALESLLQNGADTIIQLDAPPEKLAEAFTREAGKSAFQVVIDYVWGHPTETFLSAITRTEFAAITTETRLVQVGEGAGPTIALSAAVLRSTPITITGTAGIPPREMLAEAMTKVLAHAASGELRILTETIPLSNIEQAWQRNTPGVRLVVIP